MSQTKAQLVEGLNINTSAPANALVIDSSGRVGIGTTSPGSYASAADDLVVYNSGSAGITIRSGSSNDGSIYFNDTDDGNQRGIIRYVHGDDALAFHTPSGESMRIDSSGNVGINESTPDSKVDILYAAGTDATTQKLIHLRTDGSGSYVTRGLFVKIGRDGSYDNSAAHYDIVGSAGNSGTHIFEVQGSEKLRIDSSGNVGIGTSSPIFLTDILAGTANTGANANNPSQLSVTGANKTLTGGGATVFINSNSDLAVDTGGSIALSGRNTTSSTNSIVHAAIKGAKENATSANGDAYLAFATQSHSAGALVERMRVDSGGRLLVGKTSSSKNARIVAQGNSDNSSSSAEVYLQRDTATPPDGSDLASIHFADNTGTTGAVIRGRRDGGTWSGSSKPSSLLFSTCADGGTALATRMMISNDGRVATHMSSTSGLVLGTAGNATNYTIIKGKSSSTGINTGNDVFYVYGNGNVQNSNNSYGQISDQKLKENIVDANSQWDNIKDVRVRNFNFIEGQTHTQIGVVAQELEAVSPGLIDEAPDRDEDGNDLGTVTKSVKYSVLYMKAVKALQEAMTRIETLETEVAALKAG